MINNKRKIVLCDHWIKGNCKNTKKECNFAHGENDIIKINKVKCHYGINCKKENCNFNHPKEIFEDDENIKKINNNILLPKDEDFSKIIENNKYKYSEVLSSELKSKLNIKDDTRILSEKNNNNDDKDINYKRGYLEKLENEIKDWSLQDEDISKIENEIENVKNDIIFLENNKNEDKYLNDDANPIPSVDININIIDIEDINNDLEIKNQDEINKIILYMKKDFDKYSEHIKKYINYKIKDDYLKLILMNNLNNIKTKITLFEYNYNDQKFFIT